jgi:hypothetical protein
MKKLETKKALEIATKLSDEYCGQVDIYYGCPDARFKEQYFAILRNQYGCMCTGTYGHIIRGSQTLKGLNISEEK